MDNQYLKHQALEIYKLQLEEFVAARSQGNLYIDEPDLDKIYEELKEFFEEKFDPDVVEILLKSEEDYSTSSNFYMNVNDFVGFEFTKEGAKLYNMETDYNDDKVKEGDHMKLPLWQFIEIMRNGFFAHADPVVKDNKLYFVEYP